MEMVKDYCLAERFLKESFNWVMKNYLRTWVRKPALLKTANLKRENNSEM